jgi:hypothetical protein
MKISRVLMLFLAIAAGVYGVHRLKAGGVGTVDKSSADKQIETAKQILAKEIASSDIACMRETFTFPFSTREGGQRCDRCEDLYQAGLLTKTVEEYQKHDQTAYDTRFELTNLGASVYEERVYAASGSKVGKICFGKAALYRIDEMLPPLNLGGETRYGVTFTLELLNPHPFIFDPRSKALNVEAPTPGTPALYPPRITTISIAAGGGYVDDSFRYGKYLNK